MAKVLRQFKYSLVMISKNKVRSSLTVMGIILATMLYTLGMIGINYFKTQEYIPYMNFPANAMLVFDNEETSLKGYQKFTLSSLIPAVYASRINIISCLKVD